VINSSSGVYTGIYEVVREIPFGRVATYGQIATFVDHCTARMVGYALAALRQGSGVPWHRVINSSGRISKRTCGDGHDRQRKLLAAEGILLDRNGRVDLERFGWRE
jgi:methylated-DNA-protein-cysteine methyltransferase-like protein